MNTIIEGGLDGSSLHVGVAAARWNPSITDRLLEGALRRLDEMGVTDVTVLRVPGALELPVAARRLAEAGCDAVIAIGCVVKGETDHYDIVVRESASGIGAVAVQSGVPVANAILAVHDFQLALDRAGDDDANKGREAAEAAVSTANALASVE